MNKSTIHCMMWATIILSALLITSQAQAATTEIYPATVTDCNEEFENIAKSLKPGDELVLHGGTYSQSCRRAITVNGSASDPIVIRAADSEIPLLTRPQPPDYSYPQNNIEIVNSSYLVIKGLRFKGGDTGVRFIGGHHITIEDSEIYETGNNAIAMNSGNYDSFTIRHNHIHHTGLSTADSTEGEGMYLGCNNNKCRVTNSLIEGNYIHHLRGTSNGGNDGIEVKAGSYGNIIRNNVIHDTIIGREYPCIFVYGGGDGVNIVEGNAMWNCGEAIQVVSDAVIRNNIILNSDVGITAAPHNQVSQMRNVTIVNNTIVGHNECLFIKWSEASNMTLANNAVYCTGNTGVKATGLSGIGITVSANFVVGSLSGATIDGVSFLAGGSTALTFRDVEGMDFWPASTSALIGKANKNFVPTLDFNETERTSPYDVGAYEIEDRSTNPGWKIIHGFKDINPKDALPPVAPANLRLIEKGLLPAS